MIKRSCLHGQKGRLNLMKQENYIKGMIMIILSAFFFACMNVSVRLAGDLPSVEKSFFRNLVAAVFAAIILRKNRTVPKVDKKYWGPLILRCVCGTLGILCNFYAIDHLLVADASILNKSSCLKKPVFMRVSAISISLLITN